MLRHLWNDLRYAARRLSGSPAFTAAAVATIAIGVGINTGIFSVLNGFALRELPAPAAGELVSIYQIFEGIGRRVNGARSMFSVAEYEAYRDNTRTLSGIVAYSTPNTVTLAGESPQEISGSLVSCNYFDVLRLPLALGAGFGPRDCAADGSPTVVLAHDLWTTSFGADPAIVGRHIVLNRQSFTVVGVAQEGVRGLDLQRASYFAPFSTEMVLSDAGLFRNENASWLTLIGRRASGAILEQVRAELAVIAARIDAAQPPRKTTLVIDRARTLSLPEARRDVFSAAGVVMAAFGMTLLIACANVANLLLARATGRSTEIAVRLSLGASRRRIVQQLLAEAALLAVAGGALGSLLVFWSSQSLVAFALSNLPVEEASRVFIDTRLDGRVLTYAFGLTLAACLLFGLLPALRASKRDLHTAIKGASAVGHRSEGRLQGAFVAAQVALCMVLILGASLLLRGLYEAQTVEPGFRYDDVAVGSFDLPGGGYDEQRATVFQRELMERVRALPGVQGVAQTQRTPLAEGNMETMAGLPGQQELFRIGFTSVSADYFSVVEIPIMRGRAFTPADETNESTVAIVPEATARRLWPDRDPVGQKLAVSTGPNQGVELEIVGVARDAQITTVGELTSSYVYFPAAPRSQRNLRLLVKSGVDFAATAAGIRAAVAGLDPGLVVRVEQLEANLEYWRSLARVVGALASSLGAVALALAAVGIYGVVAYAVGRRVREIGVRMALGASTRDVVALVLKQQMRPVAIGALVGLAAAVALSRILSSVLFGVSPTDTVALVATVLVVGGVALMAGFLPARRASRVDPNTVLHYE